MHACRHPRSQLRCAFCSPAPPFALRVQNQFQNSTAHVTAPSLDLQNKEIKGKLLQNKCLLHGLCGEPREAELPPHAPSSNKPHLPSSLQEPERCPWSPRCPPRPRHTARAFSPPAPPNSRSAAADLLSRLLTGSCLTWGEGARGCSNDKGVIQGSSDTHAQLPDNS